MTLKPYSTDTGTRYDDEEKAFAAAICATDCVCRRVSCEWYPQSCPDWNWHVYAAIDAVAKRRALARFNQTMTYLRGVAQ